MPLLFVKEDITKMKVDAIVNAANTELRMGSGVCGAIFHAAGEEKMTEACQKLSPIRTGEAVMTDGFAPFLLGTSSMRQDLCIRKENWPNPRFF